MVKLRIGENCPVCSNLVTVDMLAGDYLKCAHCGAFGKAARKNNFLRMPIIASLVVLLTASIVWLFTTSLPRTIADAISPQTTTTKFEGMTAQKALQTIRRCQRMADHVCREDGFRYLTEIQPGNYIWRANHAFALTNNGKFAEAENIYVQIVDDAEVTADVFGYAAKNAKAMGSIEAAIERYENSIAVSPRYSDVVRELTELYSNRGENLKALSLVRSFSYKFPDAAYSVKGTLQFLKNRLSTVPTEEARTVALKSVDRGHFYLPVYLKNSEEPVPFLFDTGATTVAMDTESFEKIPSNNKKIIRTTFVTIADGSKLKATLGMIKTFAVGPWRLDNVKVLHCPTCQTLLGMTAISKFDYDYKSNGNLHTLNLKPR